jgi:hypothetical protein
VMPGEHGHIPGEFEHKGEDVERTEKASTATAGSPPH